MSISTVLKKLSLTTAGATFVALGIQGVGHATVLTFDDIAPVSDYGQIPNGYGGFNWSNFYYHSGSNPVFSDTGYDHGRVSGDYTAFNGGLQATALVSESVKGSVFDFNSADLTAAWNNGLSVTVQGLKNNSVLYTKTVTVDTTAPTLVDFNFLGVDELIFNSSGGVEPTYLASKQSGNTSFALDNFTYNATNTASVPEPSDSITEALVVLGLGGLLIKRKLSSNKGN